MFYIQKMIDKNIKYLVLCTSVHRLENFNKIYQTDTCYMFMALSVNEINFKHNSKVIERTSFMK